MIYEEKEVAPGEVMYVMAGAIGPGSGTVVAMHIDRLTQATDEEIAAYMRGMIETALVTEAIFLADRFIADAGDRLVPGIVDRYPDDIARIERHAGKHPKIDHFIAMLVELRLRVKRKSKISKLRSKIQANYHKLFMALGRRDGFRCAHCGSSEGDLQIDHIVALVNGGDNELSNLQLLCAKCNGSKSDKAQP